MNIVWAVLGVILVAFVATMLYAYFVMRPKLAKQVESSVAVVAGELHGREPLAIVPARCEGITEAARESLVGVGSLALTENGVVFGIGDPARSLIIPRDRISDASQVREFRGASKAVRKREPMLAIRWRGAADQELAVAFTVADPVTLAAELNR